MQSEDRAGMARRGGGRGTMRGMLGAAVACAALFVLPSAASAATVAFGGGAVTTYSEGNAGQTAVSLPYSVSCGLAEFSSPSVDVVLSAGTATPTSDYTSDGAQTQAFSCLAGLGGGTGTATAKIVGDALDEPDETFTMKLVDSANPATVLDSRVITIMDDDAPPTISIADAPAATEGTAAAGAGLVFPVTLSAPSGRDVTVHYATGGVTDTATADADYTATSGTLTIPAGSTTGSITVPVTADSVDEDDETVSLTLSSPVNAGFPGGTPPTTLTAAGTITDDDTATITLTGAAILEGAAGTTTTTNAIVNLSTASAKAITVDYATSDGTATAGTDYTAASGTVTVPAGARTASIPVKVIGDAAVEPDETITVKIKNPSPVTPISSGGDTATITIRNDDVAPATPTTTLPGGGTGLPGGTPGTGLPLPVGSVDAPITLSRLTYDRTHHTMRFAVRCPALGGACKGTLTVFSVPDRRSKVKALRQEQQLASKRFSVAAGGTASLTLKLSKKATSWLRTAKSIKVVGYAVATSPLGGVSTAKAKGTLKR